VGFFVSNSGNTAEVLAVLPHFRRLGALSIAITGNTSSALAKYADIVVDAAVESEADPLHLAPTSSTTLQLVIGDALAGMVAQLRGLRSEDFAAFHPGGTLGRRLLTRVVDLMGSAEQLPKVQKDVSVEKALFEITDKKYGATCVVNETGELVGVFTDGDLRRLLERGGISALNYKIEDCMTRTPVVIEEGLLAVDAVRVMEERKITVLIVVDDKNRKIPLGMVQLYELLKSGIA
jgi:arabinose-5-phosphate isomerase